MKEERVLVSEADGLKLQVLAVYPQKKIRGILQIVHGMSENKERYLPFMEYMADQGLAVIIHDHRGHGGSVKSRQDLGYFYGGGAGMLVADTHQITLYARQRWPEVPLVLMGHSMGSMVVRAYAKKYDADLDALIVCGSPGKNPLAGAGRLLVRCMKPFFGAYHRSNLLKNMSFGSFAKKFPDESSEFSWCCSDPEVVRAYEESPLCGFTFTLDGYMGLLELMQETYSYRGWKVKNPGLPIAFVAGAEDPCVGSKKKFAHAVGFMRSVGYRRVKGKLYPGMRHEILNEKGKEKVYQDLWCFIHRALKI